MFLGIEIGGTKLQLGVGAGDGSPLVELQRFEIERRLGAEGILRQIEAAGKRLLVTHPIANIGIGFGGPVDAERGVVTTSHQIQGWTGFPLIEWCQKNLQRKTFLQNDCDAAGLAEARFGAGRGQPVVLYVTVGTGIGGGLMIDGSIYRGSGVGAAEIGHLRPGVDAKSADQTVESIASGWGIARAARAALGKFVEDQSQRAYIDDLLARCGGNAEALTAKTVALAACEGNLLALQIINAARRCLAWAIAQVATIVFPNVVVIGGGVSLMDKKLFLDPLQAEVDGYVFPPLAGKFQLLPADFGEDVVVQGALTIAAGAAKFVPTVS
jgi:glucokinase